MATVESSSITKQYVVVGVQPSTAPTTDLPDWGPGGLIVGNQFDDFSEAISAADDLNGLEMYSSNTNWGVIEFYQVSRA
jgi:hypothetical protein